MVAVVVCNRHHAVARRLAPSLCIAREARIGCRHFYSLAFVQFVHCRFQFQYRSRTLQSARIYLHNLAAVCAVSHCHRFFAAIVFYLLRSHVVDLYSSRKVSHVKSVAHQYARSKVASQSYCTENNHRFLLVYLAKSFSKFVERNVSCSRYRSKFIFLLRSHVNELHLLPVSILNLAPIHYGHLSAQDVACGISCNCNSILSRVEWRSVSLLGFNQVIDSSLVFYHH